MNKGDICISNETGKRYTFEKDNGTFFLLRPLDNDNQLEFVSRKDFELFTKEVSGERDPGSAWDYISR